jgi:hypothetical protein
MKSVPTKSLSLQHEGEGWSWLPGEEDGWMLRLTTVVQITQDPPHPPTPGSPGWQRLPQPIGTYLHSAAQHCSRPRCPPLGRRWWSLSPVSQGSLRHTGRRWSCPVAGCHQTASRLLEHQDLGTHCDGRLCRWGSRKRLDRAGVLMDHQRKQSSLWWSTSDLHKFSKNLSCWIKIASYIP